MVQNPNLFLSNGWRYWGAGGNDITRGELFNADHYLDQHPEDAEELERNPNLINDHKWRKHHKDLDEWLESHPGVAEELSENPRLLMSREWRVAQSGQSAETGHEKHHHDHGKHKGQGNDDDQGKHGDHNGKHDKD